MKKPIWIRGGTIIDPINNREEVADLYVDDGRIVENLSSEQKEQAFIIEAPGKIVSPGFIDINVSLCEPGGSHREGIRSGSKRILYMDTCHMYMQEFLHVHVHVVVVVVVMLHVHVATLQRL